MSAKWLSGNVMMPFFTSGFDVNHAGSAGLATWSV